VKSRRETNLFCVLSLSSPSPDQSCVSRVVLRTRNSQLLQVSPLHSSLLLTFVAKAWETYVCGVETVTRTSANTSETRKQSPSCCSSGEIRPCSLIDRILEHSREAAVHMSDVLAAIYVYIPWASTSTGHIDPSI
jgi:hypothetical protein